MEETHTFLARFPPFDALPEEELERVASAARVLPVSAGATVLVEDGTPSDSFYVVRDGSMELVHEDEIIDVLEPGEGFGHPSLLTGMAPAFTVRAHEDSSVLVIPREQAMTVFARPEGIGFVAGSLRERLTRTGHVVHGLPEVRTVHVEESINRSTPVCDADTSIRECARRMTEADATAALVRLNGDIGLVTDADLRARVVGGEIGADEPVRAVAVAPAPTVRSDQLALETMIDLVARDLDHVAVVDERGEVLGTVSPHELLGLEARSPFALRRTILRARDEDELVEACSRLPSVFLALIDAGLSASDVGRVLALAHDAATVRLIDFSIWRHGPAPAAWAWLALGSAARRELTMSSDQDNALAFGGSDDPSTEAYFERMGQEVSAGLVRCGWKRDPNAVVAAEKLWRKPLETWKRVFSECYERPDRSHLIRATVAFDFRHVSGGLDVVPPLVEILRRARWHPDFLRRLARTATDFKPPLGFRGSIVVERDGRGSGHLDIKRGGQLPITNLARFHALASGVTISATLDRLVAAEELGQLDAEAAQALREAFEIALHVRLHHHAAQIEGGETPDDLVDPNQLPPLARRQLREAFRAIADAQKRLGVHVRPGI